MAKKFSYHFVGTLYGCPSVVVSAVEDGEHVLTVESPTGESACYPSAPWYRRYTREQFLNLPFYKNWNTQLSRFQVELALTGQSECRAAEWPQYAMMQHQYPPEWIRKGYVDVCRLVSDYHEIEDGVVI
jgi:hypothetical protein